MTPSECESRFLRPNITITRQLKTSRHERSILAHEQNGNEIMSLSKLDDATSTNVNRNVIGLSPISGDSPSEFDNGTFKTSLPSSTSSSQSSKHPESFGNTSQRSLVPQRNRDNIREGNQSLKPHVSRLRERYSRPERFEDSYVMSNLHTSTMNHDENDKSVSRSLLQTFEYATSSESNRYKHYDV